MEANKNKAEAKENPFISSEKTFDAFKQYHLDLLQNSDDEGLQALCRFLQNWQPAHFAAENLPCRFRFFRTFYRVQNIIYRACVKTRSV